MRSLKHCYNIGNIELFINCFFLQTFTIQVCVLKHWTNCLISFCFVSYLAFQENERNWLVGNKKWIQPYAYSSFIQFQYNTCWFIFYWKSCAYEETYNSRDLENMSLVKTKSKSIPDLCTVSVISCFWTIKVFLLDPSLNSSIQSQETCFRQILIKTESERRLSNLKHQLESS